MPTNHKASEEQMLTSYNHGREEMRCLRKREWQLTNYAVLGYGALAGAPFFVENEEWRNSVGVCAFVLVLLVALQAGRSLWYIEAQRQMEHDRLLAAIRRLSWMRAIERHHPPLKRSERPWWVRLWGRDCENAPQKTNGRFEVRLGLGMVVVVGAGFAIVIISSRLPWFPVFPLACLAAIVIVLSSWVPWVRRKIFRLPT
jgi:hypothetical protein